MCAKSFSLSAQKFSINSVSGTRSSLNRKVMGLGSGGLRGVFRALLGPGGETYSEIFPYRKA
jgi:hypothetical protein